MEDHSGQLLAVIRKMVRDQVEAEDILQDVYTEFIETYDLGEAIGTLGAWLVRVAKNKTLDRFRKKKTREAYMNAELLTGEKANYADPETEAERAFLGQEINKALELMPESQRDIFIQHEIEGKSFEQIAKDTGESINTLLSRKRYAVLFLRNHLKEIYDELDK